MQHLLPPPELLRNLSSAQTIADYLLWAILAASVVVFVIGVLTKHQRAGAVMAALLGLSAVLSDGWVYKSAFNSACGYTGTYVAGTRVAPEVGSALRANYWKVLKNSGLSPVARVETIGVSEAVTWHDNLRWQIASFSYPGVTPPFYMLRLAYYGPRWTKWALAPFNGFVNRAGALCGPSP